jgi:ABC-type nickel/cobalt efflux system permease component RcnA
MDEDLGFFKLIVCDGVKVACTYTKLIQLANNLITALIIISTFFATAAFAWAGILWLTSGGDESKHKEAKNVFKKVGIGYLWILGAWLLVYTIFSVLVDQEQYPSLLGDPAQTQTQNP